jgi:hypothetical protein
MYDAKTGRWLSEDPIAFSAGDANLYRYVGNNPTNKTDATGLYDDDVHFYMTYYIALAAGLEGVGTPDTGLLRPGRGTSAAYIIAWADDYADYNRKTDPLSLGEGGVIIRRCFHFRTSVDKVVENSDEAKDLVKLAIEKKNPWLMGIGLHAYQDSFSHAGYGPKGGHALDGHKPDDPSRDVKKAMRMAQGTYDLLVQYGKAVDGRVRPKKSWKEIEKKIEREFRLGEEEQRLDYSKQVAARIKRWKALIKDEFGKDLGFTFEKKNDPWQELFEAAAVTVGPPMKR